MGLRFDEGGSAAGGAGALAAPCMARDGLPRLRLNKEEKKPMLLRNKYHNNWDYYMRFASESLRPYGLYTQVAIVCRVKICAWSVTFQFLRVKKSI